MPTENGFDQSGYQKAADIVTQARTLKEFVVNIRTLRDIKLNNIDDLRLVKGRIIFPSISTDLGFSPDQLMIALINGDFKTKTEEDSETIKGAEIVAYYPHFRGELVAKTDFRMKFETALELISKCAEILGIEDQVLCSALGGYISGISFYGQEVWDLHEKDIVGYLQSGLKKD